jgi:hypothetical protein
MIETKTENVFQLGNWLGRKQAFAALAGRCSAADAECLRQVRNGKMYRSLKLSWREFCKQRLGISGSTADLTIQRLEEFGPAYFTLAQATGITPEQYRRIQGSVRGQKLLHAGEEIPIQAENAPRLAAAVEELRREQEVDSDAATGNAAEQAGTKSEDLNRVLDKLERTLAAAVSETGRVHGLRLDVTQIERLQRIVLAQLRRIPMVQLMQIEVRP